LPEEEGEEEKEEEEGRGRKVSFIELSSKEEVEKLNAL